MEGVMCDILPCLIFTDTQNVFVEEKKTFKL